MLIHIHCFILTLQAFSELPDTLDEIDAMLNDERARAECFTGLSEAVRRANTLIHTYMHNTREGLLCMEFSMFTVR